MSIKPVIKHFANYLALNEEEIKVLEQFLIEKRVNRKQFILSEGEICRHYTFVIEGCFRVYTVDSNGKEHNLQFTTENSWVADIGSFHLTSPSELYIEAIEPSLVLQIGREDLHYLFTHYPKFDRNFRVIIENEFILLQKRLLHNISSTAEERYVEFLKNYPQLFNRISNVQIASYLGITPEFLSVLRNRMARS